MMQSAIGITAAALCAAGAGLLFGSPAQAQSVMQQCGQQYQAAKAANTLNGQTWNQYRTECSARLKAQPASAPAASVPAATPATNPLKPAPAAPPPAAPPPATTASAPPAAPPPTTAPAATAAETPTKATSPGRVAFVARERQCGSEWKANKVTLKAQTPGLTWPKYLSQCNTRLKAAGQ